MSSCRLFYFIGLKPVYSFVLFKQKLILMTDAELNKEPISHACMFRLQSECLEMLLMSFMNLFFFLRWNISEKLIF